MNAFLAASPLWSSIIALALGVRSVHAALLGGVAAILSAVYMSSMPGSQIGTEILTWSPLLIEVVLIVGGGLLMSETLRHAGAQADLADWIRARAGTGTGAALLVVHGITPFAESVTGFGIGVTIGIPLLVFLGLPARNAAIVGLLGLCSVPWGSMAPGTMIAAGLAGVSFHELGIASAVFSVIPFTISGLVTAWMVSEPSERIRSCGLALVSALTLAVLVGLSNYFIGTAPAGALGATFLIIIYLILSRKRDSKVAKLSVVGRRALQGYGVLLGGVLLTTLVLRAFDASEYWRYLSSPALWLFASAVWFARGRVPEEPRHRAWNSWVKVAPVTAIFILMGIIMAVSGTAAYLAGLLSGLNAGYVAVAPMVGAFGGFITGSSSGSNAMFAATQAEIARSLDLNLLAFMALHNVAAGYAILASPGKIEMALQLAGEQATAYRRETQRMAILVVVTAGALLGLINLVMAYVS